MKVCFPSRCGYIIMFLQEETFGPVVGIQKVTILVLSLKTSRKF